MAYRLLSLKSAIEHDVSQWSSRSLAGELTAIESRSLSTLFDKYLSRRKCRILEGGCGFGAWCEWFNRRGHNAIGLEYNATIVSAAKYFKSDLNVELGNILDIDYPDNFFDAYVSLGVIEHFESGPEQALLEAYRVIKSDGLLFVTTPYQNKLRSLIYHPIRTLFMTASRLIGYKPQFWEYRFTQKELTDFVENAGFEIVEVTIDDYPNSTINRHIGLWADWFFLRKWRGGIWELNSFGKLLLSLLHIFPEHWYCSGLLIVAKPIKQHDINK